MSDFLLDLVLPETDQAVAVQWAVMGVVWSVLTIVTWRADRDIRHFVWGCATLNLGWFMARMVH